jgi:hypothetical protein
MRPVNFVNDAKAEDITPPESEFDRYRYTLRCDDGITVQSTIRIYKSAVDLAGNDRDHCELEIAAAVDSKGRTVVEDMVLGQEDPCLKWVVHANVILEDFSLAA